MFTKKTWVFVALAVATLLSSGTAFALTVEECRGCHGSPPGPTGSTTTMHHDIANAQGLWCGACHVDPFNVDPNCMLCHAIGAEHTTCVGCHASPLGARRAVTSEFSMASRHIQTAAPATNADCEACHDGTTHMQGTVRLRVVGGTSVVYTNSQSANPHCLSCHNDANKTRVPFSDLRTPVSSTWNWDGKSIALKYNDNTVVSSNKYPPTTAAPNMGGLTYNTNPDVKRALSAHGSPALNKANGGTTDKQVPCLSCHNSHGSSASPLLYSNSTYTPGSVDNFCWDCHNNEPWATRSSGDFLDNNDTVRDYWGGSHWGMNDGTGFHLYWLGTFPDKNSSYMSSHFYPSKRKINDNNWQRSVVNCTSCHDPHGVDPTLAAKGYMVPLLKGTWLISPYKEDRAPLSTYASPLRDAPAGGTSGDQPRSCPDLPFNNTPVTGGGYANSTGQGHEGYFIDENTFGIYDNSTKKPAVSGSWRTVLNNNKTLQINRISETDNNFGGLCLTCHPKTNLITAWAGHKTVKGWGGSSRDLFPSSLANTSGGGEGPPSSGMHAMGEYASSDAETNNAKYGRGYRWGVNPSTQKTSGYIQADYHQFPCSKCHSPHAANEPRLLTTNCLDTAGNHTSYSRSKTSLANTCHSTARNLPWNTLTPHAQASKTSHVIVASANTGGTISPTGTSYVNDGASKAYTIAPLSGYKILDVRVDGNSLGVITSYNFTNVQSNHNISVIFGTIANTNYTIAASAGAGGTISPSGNVSVGSGLSQTFTATPSSGYRVANVIVDGFPMGSLSSYTFSLVTDNHTINATFDNNTRVIRASAGVGGRITPSGSVTLSYGGSQTFAIAPDNGYRIAGVLVDNVSVGAVASYAFTNVTTNRLISASFSAAPRVNLALNKTATASSSRTGTSYTPAKAVDNSVSTSWMSSTTSSAQWVRVDLGSSMSISNIVLTWPATYYAQAFQIQTSTDGTTWTSRYTLASGGTGAAVNVTFTAANARYVRVYCTTRNNSSYYGVAELAVYQ